MTTTTTTELNDNEKALLAREIAADRFDAGEDVIEVQCDECNERFEVDGVPLAVVRLAVKHGWDAAIEYMEKK